MGGWVGVFSVGENSLDSYHPPTDPPSQKQLTALNEVLLNNHKIVGEDGVVLGQPRNLRERAEKEVRLIIHPPTHPPTSSISSTHPPIHHFAHLTPLNPPTQPPSPPKQQALLPEKAKGNRVEAEGNLGAKSPTFKGSRGTQIHCVAHGQSGHRGSSDSSDGRGGRRRRKRGGYRVDRCTGKKCEETIDTHYLSSTLRDFICFLLCVAHTPFCIRCFPSPLQLVSHLLLHSKLPSKLVIDHI